LEFTMELEIEELPSESGSTASMIEDDGKEQKQVMKSVHCWEYVEGQMHFSVK
ncbi:hypothetical protein AVEN_247006-1, partial [Araneus ventricosus]